MEYLVVITVLNHSGSFGQNFVKFKKKNKNVIHQPWLSRIGKTVPEVLSAARGSRHRAQFFPIRTSRLANNIYLSEIIHRLSVFPTYESKITFHILICLCWSHSFAPIHQNLKFRTWVQVITVLKMWDISLHSRSLYSIRRRVFNISVWTTFRRAIYSWEFVF